MLYSVTTTIISMLFLYVYIKLTVSNNVIGFSTVVKFYSDFIFNHSDDYFIIFSVITIISLATLIITDIVAIYFKVNHNYTFFEVLYIKLVTCLYWFEHTNIGRITHEFVLTTRFAKWQPIISRNTYDFLKKSKLN